MQTALRRSLISGRAAARCGVSAPVASSSRAWLSTSSRQFADEKKGGLLKSVLYGSDKAKAEAPAVDGEGGGAQAAGNQGGKGYSKVLGRGKYIHELYKHRVKPDRVDEYKSLVAQFYDSLAKNPDVDIKLTGSWEVIVGELDTFYHVWEHSGFHGYDEVVPKMAASKEYQDFAARLAPTLVSRSSQLIQEFSFWPSSPPKVLGGIYEMRTYSLKPGSLLEWEQEWRVGLEARKQFVEPIAAFFAQVGELHQVIHMWHYDSMESRKQMRQRAWEIDTWSNTVAKTVKLTDHMSAQILSPLPFSPLR